MAKCGFCKQEKGFESTEVYISYLGRSIIGIQCKSCKALCGVLDNTPISELVQKIYDYQASLQRDHMLDISKRMEQADNNRNR